MRVVSKKLLSTVTAIIMTVQVCVSTTPITAKADTTSIITEYQPTINEVIDVNGFKHPGVGFTKEILENMRSEVLAQKEPWISYFNAMLTSSAASRNVNSKNQSKTDVTKPAGTAFNSKGVESKFIDDALKAYTQAVLYYVTGDEIYRANALHIIRIWSQMNPTQYAYYADACIHTGIPLNRMVNAAEILRYTSHKSESYVSAAGTTENLNWTDQDTTNFTGNLINPVINTFEHDNNHFMNQHLYSLLGAMSGYIFTGNRDRYNEGVEWFTVNKSASDQGQNGSIKQLFRLVDTNALTGEKVTPLVEQVEMGRDQAHGAGDITNMEILARLLLAQGTKVDPVAGTVSTGANAIGPYEFLDNRILKAADYFAQFMLGYDTPWVPTAAHTDASGKPTIIYKALSQQYRGRLTQNTWELYYYYKYGAGINMEQAAPYFTKMFADRVSYNWDGVDGGGDFWITIPKAAEAEGTKYLVNTITDPYRQIEDRYTAFDNNSTTMQEGNTSFVRIISSQTGSKIALVGCSNASKNIGFRIRTNGIAKLQMAYSINDAITLPNTNGQWKYVTYALNNYQSMGDLIYLNVIGDGATVDLDCVNINSGSLLTPPAFKNGNSTLNLFTYVGSQNTINYDFSAADTGSTDVVSYQIDNKPDGVNFDESTGAFSWKPAQVGSYSFIVSASDGTTITPKEVKVTVTKDRKSAVQAAIEPYNPKTMYTSSTLDNYNKAYTDIMNAISSSSDEVFYQKLCDLNTAVVELQLLTPLMDDGSIDYRNIFASSTFGNQLPNLLDNDPGSFAGYYLAKNLTYYMDLGADYKVSASAFKLQVRASFPERIGGTTIYGSNDNENWTRLTSDETKVTEDMQTLEVDPQYKNQQFRFLKIQMIHPSSSMLELSEFRIFGQRCEVATE